MSPRLPKFAAALLESLQFPVAGDRLAELTKSEWTDLLSFCDRAQLTLTFGYFAARFLPDWVSARIAGNMANNAERHRQWKAAVFEIANGLEARGIDFTLLKGHAHSPDFTPDPLLRAHSDIDLWCQSEAISDAAQVLSDLGYRPFAETKGRHLPPFVRLGQWTWRGDYFATDLPIPIDLHYALWDRNLERLDGPCEPDLWLRRGHMQIDGRIVPALCLPDTLAFAALHSLMHMFHGDLRLQRAWEIAYFLNNRTGDSAFWAKWHALHPPDLRVLEATMFALTAVWFQCKLSPLVLEEIEKLPPDVRIWIEHRAWSPLEALFMPNKDEMWLHLALVRGLQDKARVFMRRMVPIEAVSDRDRQGREVVFARAVHHLRTLLPTLTEGAKWWWIRQGFQKNFLIFLFSSGLFDVGEFIFFLLYNLYLVDLGFNEKLLGGIRSAMSVGSFLGVLPAAALVRRWGLRSVLVLAIAAVSVTTALRAVAIHPTPLLLLAFLNGVFLSIWAVCLPPSVAASSTAHTRARSFSLVSSMGIGIGVGAGFLGGRLPAILSHFGAHTSPLEAKRAALLLGAAIVSLAILPALRLRFPEFQAPSEERKIYPRGSFIIGFIAAVFIWSFATGIFNPFFNVYFAQRLHFSIERIGTVFSFSQLAQVVAILAAPLFLRRVPGARGVSTTQVATALMLAWLAAASSPTTAAIAYISYMAFQNMASPCLFTLLMDRVTPSERGGTSALNFFATSLAGALSAMAAGVVLPRLGYSPVLAVAALLAFIAAALMFATRALYNAGNPTPRPQSLAKTMPLESGSQAGA